MKDRFELVDMCGTAATSNFMIALTKWQVLAQNMHVISDLAVRPFPRPSASGLDLLVLLN